MAHAQPNKERRVSEVVVQVSRAHGGEPAKANTARKTLPRPSKHQFQCLKKKTKESVQGEEMGFGWEDKAQHAHMRCRPEARDMG